MITNTFYSEILKNYDLKGVINKDKKNPYLFFIIGDIEIVLSYGETNGQINKNIISLIQQKPLTERLEYNNHSIYCSGQVERAITTILGVPNKGIFHIDGYRIK